MSFVDSDDLVRAVVSWHELCSAKWARPFVIVPVVFSSVQNTVIGFEWKGGTSLFVRMVGLINLRGEKVVH